ncbi:MAG TPA: aminotransferase class I/II-fold pyridoxal phosphate-dependent enzyme [Candidatus Brocadiia bacterium]|nr:aminotransferase class I/II-fold pyridoxal phosphate-dependent enzyme [Planctomycetota bacterium]MBI4007363.1 aminotransferase class I/II-fold pyridoxal phosphate-dependent enzyme [Planctomycetota bacterium]MDO8093091.1 aminotransferase class I/II-fold pyridoxal phosphate-dependent enzyme [Candidatus Brocadiales bacterium]
MGEFTINVATRVKRLPPYLFGRLNALKYEKRRKGIDIIDLGMGNPNDPTPKPIIDKLCEAVQDPRNHRYSVSAIGIFNLRREVAKYYQQQWGVELDPETEVVCTIGSKEGFSHLCLGLLEGGDTALVPNPAFPIHIHSVAIAGANVISVPLTEPKELLAGFEDVARNIFPRPKVLIINFPHNPTAATVDLDFFEGVVAFARKYNIIVVHDFAYSSILFDGYKAPSFLQVKGAKEVGVEFNTMSKTFNMAGWRLGFCVGNRQVVEALAKVKGYYDYGIFQPVQIASIIALRHCQEYAEKQAKIYQSRRDVLCDSLNRIGWDVKKPRASMFVWAPIPERFRSMGSFEFALKLIEEAEVAVAPGSAFGENGEGYLRLAIVENELRLKQAVRQIDRALRQPLAKQLV